MKKLIVAIAAFALMAGSAYAAEWNFYGSARVQTFWSSTDTINGTSGNTVVNDMGLMTTSRIGANVKVSDELTGRFEYGGDNTAVTVRHLYGEWNFGAGTLMVGHSTTPVYVAYSNQAFGDDGMGDTGDIYSGRQAQVRLKFGEFHIALVDPNATAIAAGTTEVSIPTIEARYTFNFDNISLRIVGGYNSYEETVATVKYDIDSYVVGVGAQGTFGPFTLAANVYTGENAGNIIGVDTRSGAANDGLASIVGGAVRDNDVMGYQLVAAYTVNDMFGLEVGYGYVEEDYNNTTALEDEACTYYIQAPITLAPGVTVVPEIGAYDYKENGQQDTVYYGAKWQINF